MERRWTYARNRMHHGEYSAHDLTVLLNGEPVGTVRYFSGQGTGAWQWRVTLTQDSGNCAERRDALEAVRASLTAQIDEPF